MVKRNNPLLILLIDGNLKFSDNIILCYRDETSEEYIKVEEYLLKHNIPNSS